MSNIVNWVMSNITTICTIAFAFIAIASIVVKLTKTTKDDEFLCKLVTWLDNKNLSLATSAKNKEYIEFSKKQLDIK